MSNSIYIFRMQEDGTLVVSSMKGKGEAYPDFTTAKGFDDLPADAQEQITLLSDLLSEGDPLTDFLSRFGGLGIDPLTEFLINSGGSFDGSMPSIFGRAPRLRIRPSLLDLVFSRRQQRGSQPEAPMCPPGHQWPDLHCNETCPGHRLYHRRF